MTSRSGDLVLSFNGEIYNYVELRSELKAKGRQFQSQSDTEVQLQAYDEWGESCVENSMACGPLPFSTNATIAFVHETETVFFMRQSDGFYFGRIRQLLPIQRE